tara:strand:- start:294 stop:1457 length:1164 start_codon:yes stop_codon:yes gene_type:complete
MTSSIIRTNPTAGTATTSSVRDNFGAAADEINRLLRATTDKAQTSGTDTMAAQFGTTPAFALIDGIRVLVEISLANTVETPTLDVNGTGPKDIIRADGGAIGVGTLTASGFFEMVYDSQAPTGPGVWRVLNLPTTTGNVLFSAILAGVHPVGSIITSSIAADPGTEGYFFSGVSFGTWEAYAEGTALGGVYKDVSLDQETITAVASTGLVTVNTQTPHKFFDGDYITIAGVPTVGGVSINGNFRVSSSSSATQFKYYEGSISQDTSFTGDVNSVVYSKDYRTANSRFGERLTDDVADHNHQWLTNINNAVDRNLFYANTSGNLNTNLSYDVNGDVTDLSAGTYSDSYVDRELYTSDVKTNLVSQSAPSDYHDNTQPTVAAYIWKRTA